MANKKKTKDKAKPKEKFVVEMKDEKMDKPRIDDTPKMANPDDYIVKSKLNAKIVVKKSPTAKARDKFILPARGTMKVTLKPEEVTFIQANYSKMLVLRKAA